MPDSEQQRPEKGEVRQYTVAEDDDGIRLDRWFKRHLPEVGFAAVARWARTGQVRVDGARAKPEDRLVTGQTLRIPIPPLTEERRKDLVKLAGKYAEQQKIAVRNVRRDANDDLKKAEKASDISQDEQKKMEAEVQKDTDAAVKRIDEMMKVKEAEIMQV